MYAKCPSCFVFLYNVVLFVHIMAPRVCGIFERNLNSRIDSSTLMGW